MNSLHSKLLIEAAEFCRDSGLTVYLVGGAVRDLVMDRDSRDLDFLVWEPRGAKKLAEYFHRAHGFHRPVLFAARLNQAGRKIETFQIARRDLIINIVSPRGADLEEDLRFRDFTINTLIISLEKIAKLKFKAQSSKLKGKNNKSKNRNLKLETSGPLASRLSPLNFLPLIEDPLETGKRDLRRKLIRTPSNSTLTIADDPLRMLRAVRIARELDFSLAPELKKEIRKSSKKISSVSLERIRDEFEKLILMPDPSQGILLLEKLGLLGEMIPELQAAVGFEQKSPYHHEDLFRHSLSTLDRTREDLALRLAALFHDLGKIEAQRLISRGSQGGLDYFVYWGHQDGSAEKSKEILRRLCFPRKIRNEVQFLVQHHMVNYQTDWKDSTIRRLTYRLGPHLQKTLELLKADSASLKPPFQKDKGFEELAGRIAGIQLEEGQKVKCPLDGFEIQKLLKIGPGQEVGRAKKMVIEAILDGKISADRSEAKKYLRGNFVPKP